MVVARNAEFVPPYGYGSSMYLRPLLLGTGPELGLTRPKEYTFVVYATPVGNYYADGIVPVPAVVVEDFDRSAPFGTGHGKLGGNYAPVFRHSKKAKDKGFAITLHLDPKTRTYVDEFSTSNFVAIKQSAGTTTFVVPNSPSILKSVVAKSLMELAVSYGWKVEMRPVPWTEVETFAEVAACGTAAVITPIKTITRGNQIITFGTDDNIGPCFLRFFNSLRAIQDGDEDDRFGWIVEVDV